MNKVIITRSDGSIAILHPTSEATEKTIERDALNTPDYVSHRELTPEEELPVDRVFRNAWVDMGKNLAIDIDKAKKIKQDIFREARKPLFEELDIAYMRADEAGDAKLKQNIVFQKQLLRDVTGLELPDDIQTLSEFTPDILKDKSANIK